MSEFLGSRISLISKSDIRYVGILHEINSDESTVSLENVRSFGTEGRRNRPEEEIAPSDQVYDYIIFRGSDVKDLRIEDHPGIKENKPPAMPEDPAIVNARPRPGQGPSNQPPPAPGFGQPPFQNNFYPPPGPWGPAPGRGGPGAGMGGMPYPPPPGWFPPGPPGQGFPGPDQWNNYNYPPGPGGPGPRGPPGPPVPQGPGAAPGQAPENRGTPDPQEQRPAPVGAAGDKQKPATPAGQSAPSEPKPAGPPGFQQAGAPTPPVDSKPSAAEVKATVASLNATGPKPVELPAPAGAPTGPKNPTRVQPAIPLAGSVPKAFAVPTNDSNAPQTVPKPVAGPTAASVRDATEAAKAAVALAMANMNAGNAAIPPAPQGNGNVMDNLTKKVNEMRVNAARPNQPSANRGRGRGGRQGQSKVDVPEGDFDFAQANAKFNKDDLVKEAIAGSPLGETLADGPVTDIPATEVPGSNPPNAYNKTRSFFDNISSEAKERAENGGQKPGGREWRGEEQRKNMETFGQGSVDGGYRGYRGRGRGRGRGGFGGRGARGGYRGRGGQGVTPATPATN
ncbi:Protein sum2 [Colletotrichum chlorophyti]|uniref:Protein sum2 n=1 Tax=Colletotrichum chlorophyti TaxID=708187 RepID=A0A1Q8RSR4_9PEZI|nr:Protein sum2 [Colletotrichum chlorophyti]